MPKMHFMYGYFDRNRKLLLQEYGVDLRIHDKRVFVSVHCHLAVKGNPIAQRPD